MSDAIVRVQSGYLVRPLNIVYRTKARARCAYRMDRDWERFVEWSQQVATAAHDVAESLRPAIRSMAQMAHAARKFREQQEARDA